MTLIRPWKRGTAAQRAANSTVPLGGEIGVETDTGRAVASNGVTAWKDLPYFLRSNDALPYAPISATWLPNTAYKSGELVVNSGLIYSALADFTSGASFNSANWALVSGVLTDTGTLAQWTNNTPASAGTVWAYLGIMYCRRSTGTDSTFIRANWTELGLDPTVAAPLAQTGQIPSQLPVLPGATPLVGTENVAARADHVHPISNGLGAAFFFGMAPTYANDLLMAGAATGPGNNSYDLYRFGNLGQVASLAGSTYTMVGAGCTLAYRNITLAAGFTLKPRRLGGGLVIICSGTLTINGTIDLTGESPVAGAAPAQTVFGSTEWAGSAGGTGNTGAGSAAPTPAPNDHPSVVGGRGGSGGTSGANAGGATTPNWIQTLPPLHQGPIPWLYLLAPANYTVGPLGPYAANTVLNPMGGGAGGGGGGGDGTNKGGSGGGGGGNLLIIARAIVLGATASLKVNGGNGAPGAGGNAAGGGGGGAGAIAIHTLSAPTITAGAALSAAVGAGGAGVGTGASGSPGTLADSTTTIYDPPTSTGYGYGYGVGVLINVWQ